MGLFVRSCAERFDPATGAFSDAGELVEARFGHATLWVPGAGEVLVAGGKDIGPNGDVVTLALEWWDPGDR